MHRDLLRAVLRFGRDIRPIDRLERIFGIAVYLYCFTVARHLYLEHKNVSEVRTGRNAAALRIYSVLFGVRDTRIAKIRGRARTA